MKNQKGMGLISLIICIIIIVLIVFLIILFANKEATNEKLELYVTDMLVIQGKVKVISSTDAIKTDEDLLKGRKVQDNLEEEEIKKLLENAVISQDEEKFDKYYILDNNTLNEIGISIIDDLKEGYFIVNYDTDEIIYSKGVMINEVLYYKLTDLMKLKEELNKEEETQNVEQNNEQVAESNEEIQNQEQ